MSDLLVGMVFVFLILLIVAQLSAGEKIEKLDRLNHERVKYRAELMHRLASAVSPARVDVQEAEGVIRLPTDALFEENHADLKSGAVAIITKLSRGMARELPCASADFKRPSCGNKGQAILESVYIEGHTDPFRPKGWQDNWYLSSARAITTYRAMLDAAPELSSIRNASGKARMLGVSAYADTRPVGPEPANVDIRSGAYSKWRADNRRIEFRFLLAAPTADGA